MRVLHRHLRTEFNVRSECLTELLIIRKTRSIERCHVELNKSLSLLFCNAQMSVNIDQMSESELSSETVRTTKGLSCEGSEVIDMFRLAHPEKRLEQWVIEDTAVELLLETVQCLFTTCEFVQ